MKRKGTKYLKGYSTTRFWLPILSFLLACGYWISERRTNASLSISASLFLNQGVQIIKEKAKRAHETGIFNVLVLVGTRPEAIKLSPVVLELKRRSDRFNCILVSTGQHQEMLEQVLDAFALGKDAIDISLDLMTKDQTLASLTARVMTSMGQIFQNTIVPDMILVQGDTTTAFVGALAAFYHKIPVGHVEAGLRTRDIYSPFPEEVNRQSIGVMATMHFASTQIAAENLLKENKDQNTIFVTGNTVVDALHHYSGSGQNKEASKAVATIQEETQKRCGHVTCRLVLLTAHRRENHGEPLINIMEAMSKILRDHPDVLIVYPVHLNPNVRTSIEKSVPPAVFAQLTRSKQQQQSKDVEGSIDDEHRHFDRFLLMDPLDYPDLVQVMKLSFCIVTDSGGIQEEGAALGKPILILRENTERPEGVIAGIAKLVGTDQEKILQEMRKVLQSPGTDTSILEKARNLYGTGQASQNIVDLVDWFLRKDVSRPPPLAAYQDETTTDDVYDMVIVLTVWKRDTLAQYFQMLSKQTFLHENPHLKTNIIVFQNGEHQNVTEMVGAWSDKKNKALWGNADVTVTYIKSAIPTGYYGRFLVPLLAKVENDGYFLVCDDDVIFGNKYLENMVRVINDGYLAVRVGRFIHLDTNTHRYVEEKGVFIRGWNDNVPVTFEDDVEYDFGGHLWGGKIDWIRKAWHHPPPLLVTSEDFWISAVLKTFYGIGTKRPRCLKDDMESCACSMQEASDHKEVEVGNHTGGEFGIREEAITSIANAYDYIPLPEGTKVKESQGYTFHDAGEKPWQLEGSRFAKCLWWI